MECAIGAQAVEGVCKDPLPKRILLAAFVTFVERGNDQTWMDEVAAAAGTTKRTVHAPFGKKETLFRGTIANAVELAMARLFPNMATGPQRVATLMEARRPAPTPLWSRCGQG